jgi:lipopolysaccharide export system permease protein
MKILDKYILKSFLVPFFATFLIVLFVLVMQALWQTFENIAGKGIGLVFIFKFLYYTALMIIPQALPIGVLLSSIMALGKLGENYEFAAAKSAGVSLQRLVRPLAILAIFLSGINFLFLNNVYPYAVFKQLNLKQNIKNKQPAMALIPGSFNSEIPNYQIKFEEKYGEEENLLKKVLIYDLKSRKGNQKVITAERGMIVSEEGSKYMKFILFNGNYYEEHIKSGSSLTKRKRMPSSNATFKEYELNIDISSLSQEDLDGEKYKGRHNMLSLQQINDTLPDLKDHYDEYVSLRAKSLNSIIKVTKLYSYQDSLKTENISLNLLENFNLNNKINIINNAIAITNRAESNIKANKKNFKFKRKNLNLYDTEFYNRIAFSLSCLLLFFIGAPLGSIIRKGGFGLPMILAISIYVTYFFSNTFGKNLAEESTVSAMFGGWIAIFMMLPIAFLLTRRATRDKGLFNIDTFTLPIINFFKRFMSKKTPKI